jgi:ribonuclease P protein component
VRSWHPLRRRRDFERLYREGARFRSPLLALVVRAEPQAGPWRAATVCSKKVGGAVVRNLLKRRLRGLLDGVRWSQVTSGDLALICKPEAAAASYAELERQVRRLLARAGLGEA